MIRLRMFMKSLSDAHNIIVIDKIFLIARIKNSWEV